MMRQSIIVFGLLLCCVAVYGQRNKTAAERLAAERKKQARSLLITLASEVRSFNDLKLRARSLARIADALWESDAEQSRALFLKSWEAAGDPDANAGSYQLGESPPNLRRDVLVLVAKRDRALAEELLQKLKSQEPEPTSAGRATNLWELLGEQQQRLDVAVRLLRSGDSQRALEFADPILGNVTISTLDFLTTLRGTDPRAADSRYARMLQQTSSNPQADANTVSLLASYLFTPRMYVLFNEQGGADASWPPFPSPPATVAPELRLLFFQTAAGILVRPLPPPDEDQNSLPARFMVTKRLLPLFEQYAPESLTDALQAQLEALNSIVGNRVPETQKEWTERGIAPEKTPAEQEESLLDQVERVKTSEQRDVIYFKLAMISLTKDDESARDFVSKIADTDFRKQAQAWVDWALAQRAIEQRKPDSALKLARSDELSHLQRVWILTQAAKLIVSSDPEKALTIVDEATAEARRSDSSDDRARGLLAVAYTLMVVDRARVWEALFEVVKAANSAENFTGEESSLRTSVTTKEQINTRLDYIPEFDINGILTELAKKDFDRTVQLAHGFQREAPRANATILICRSVLNEKPTTPASTPRSGAKN